MVVGERIRDARVASTLTQRELGDLVGVDSITVSRWERGEHEPSIRTLRDIAAATSRDLNWFFSNGGEAAA